VQVRRGAAGAAGVADRPDDRPGADLLPGPHPQRLEVRLVGSFPTIDTAAGQELMEKAHQVCPYSRATRGNIEVTLEVS
jgi:organic hydroperoxide reductase OsmC/OhrA